MNRDKTCVNDEDENSNTALHLAALHGHGKVVDILLTAGADVAARSVLYNSPMYNRTSIAWAIKHQVRSKVQGPTCYSDKNWIQAKDAEFYITFTPLTKFIV